jgi:hypothetical protein
MLLKDPRARKPAAALSDLMANAIEKCEKLLRSQPPYTSPDIFNVAFRAEQLKAAQEWANPDARSSAKKTIHEKPTRFVQPRASLLASLSNLALNTPNSETKEPQYYIPPNPVEQRSRPRASTMQIHEPKESISTLNLGPKEHATEQTTQDETETLFTYYDALDFLLERGWMHEMILELPQSRSGSQIVDLGRKQTLREEMTSRAATWTSTFARRDSNWLSRDQKASFSSALSHAWHELIHPRVRSPPQRLTRSGPSIEHVAPDQVFTTLFKDRDIVSQDSSPASFHIQAQFASLSCYTTNL